MRKLLIVDDEPQILNLLAEILRPEGYQVVTSSNGIDALIQFSLESPDLLITDVNMPGMSGKELYEAMERHCLPLYQKYDIELVGYWETVMGQGPWPETIAMWEFQSFDHYTRFIRDTYEPADGNFALREWLDAKSVWFTGTDALLCFGADVTPSVAELRESGLRAKMICHETVQTAPNRQAIPRST
ncbi:MAG: response regulator, partial [Nitrospinae bacterium]|nr:response regulator [Nitrospinota bacterium]